MDIAERLRAAARHPYIDNTCKVRTYDALEAADEIEKLRAAKVELLRLFDEAMDGYADCMPYKGDYLVKKHRDEEYFAELRAAAAALKETGDV